MPFFQFQVHVSQNQRSYWSYTLQPFILGPRYSCINWRDASHIPSCRTEWSTCHAMHSLRWEPPGHYMPLHTRYPHQRSYCSYTLQPFILGILIMHTVPIHIRPQLFMYELGSHISHSIMQNWVAVVLWPISAAIIARSRDERVVWRVVDWE